MESGKVILGTSTKALEEARVDAIQKTYACSFDACYEAILMLDRRVRQGQGQAIQEEGFFDIFQKDRIKGYMVVMGIHGNVNTTEAGIFFSRSGIEKTMIEVASLSSSAKRKVAEAVFKELSSQFPEVEDILK